jgi:hypothetical protein
MAATNAGAARADTLREIAMLNVRSARVARSCENSRMTTRTDGLS